jgi:hypothetical protein
VTGGREVPTVSVLHGRLLLSFWLYVFFFSLPFLTRGFLFRSSVESRTDC